MPVVKLSENMTLVVAKEVKAQTIVVKMQELITPTGVRFNSRFAEIKAAGGIHNYLDYNGKVILSTIMPDQAIRKCTISMYADAIDTLQPDIAMTIDGETYEDKRITAEKECARCLEESAQLLRLCPDHEFYGLVKGASMQQVETSIDGLLGMGLDTLVFHAGDYVRRGNSLVYESARRYAKAIRKRSPRLFMYGISSPKHIRSFPAADGYVTQTHFLAAFNGLRLENGTWKNTGKADIDTIVHNLREINRAGIDTLAQQGGLLPWVEDTREAGLPTQAAVMGSALRRNLVTSL